MQARGLKQMKKLESASKKSVAPHAGAWIETTPNCSLTQFNMSRLMQARGLKQFDGRKAVGAFGVAPHAGAWIETV